MCTLLVFVLRLSLLHLLWSLTHVATDQLPSAAMYTAVRTYKYSCISIVRAVVWLLMWLQTSYLAQQSMEQQLFAVQQVRNGSNNKSDV